MGEDHDEKLRERAKQVEAAQEQLRQQVNNASVEELQEGDPGPR